MGAMKRLYEARQGKQDKFARGDFDGSKSDWDREMSDRFVAPGKKPRKRWARVDKRAHIG